MTPDEAFEQGRISCEKFIITYEKLIAYGYFLQARTMLISTFPFMLATTTPEYRTQMLAEILDIYFLIGKEVFEDGQDLYNLIAQPREKE